MWGLSTDKESVGKETERRKYIVITFSFMRRHKKNSIEYTLFYLFVILFYFKFYIK